MRKVLILFTLILCMLPCKSCPFCDSGAAAEIRAVLFGPDLLNNILYTLMPFAIFAMIGWLIYHGSIFQFGKKKQNK